MATRPGEDPQIDELVRAQTQPMQALGPEEARTVTLSPEELGARTLATGIAEVTRLRSFLAEFGVNVLRTETEGETIVCFLDPATDIRELGFAILGKTRGIIVRRGSKKLEFNFGDEQQKRRVRLTTER